MSSWKDKFKCQSFSAHKRPGQDQALEMLKRVAHITQPLMWRRSWVVPLLTECTPKKRNVGGFNQSLGGTCVKIAIRLRRIEAEESFYPFECILGVMLHELSHIAHMNHGPGFWKLLKELTAECEEDMAKGIAGTGEGFDAPSAGRAGGRGFGAHNVSATGLRSAMIKAAEERQKIQGLMTHGGKKLGGGGKPSQDPRQAAAEAAAKRLAQVPQAKPAPARQRAPANRPPAGTALIDLLDSDDEAEAQPDGPSAAGSRSGSEGPEDGGCSMDAIAESFSQAVRPEDDAPPAKRQRAEDPQPAQPAQADAQEPVPPPQQQQQQQPRPKPKAHPQSHSHAQQQQQQQPPPKPQPQPQPQLPSLQQQQQRKPQQLPPAPGAAAAAAAHRQPAGASSVPIKAEQKQRPPAPAGAPSSQAARPGGVRQQLAAAAALARMPGGLPSSSSQQTRSVPPVASYSGTGKQPARLPSKAKPAACVDLTFDSSDDDSPVAAPTAMQQTQLY